MRRFRTTPLLAATAISLAACGGSAPQAEEVASSAVPVLPDEANPVPDSAAVTADETADDSDSSRATGDAGDTTETDATGGDAGPVDGDTESGDTENGDIENGDTANADAETAPSAPEPGGRDLGSELRPESATASNPLPDLLVDDVRRGAQVNVANLLPSERPVLLWAWAPH